MDRKDTEILEILRRNSRTRNVQIAEELGISESGVRKRIARLVADGQITGFTIRTSDDAMTAIILMKLEPRKAGEVISSIKKMGLEIYEFSGNYDLGVSVSVTDLQVLNKYLDELRSINGVLETDTLVRLK
ncbi:MAG: Lrp/AsnC family transcriptional regulator [Candidatus Thermoplasmatota archaeon]|jgi:Lrp/AsnC family transcriptional regulator of lysine biosynthesis|nr:Lrp/AsnC family transcriptional regulator [Candidatus Thermoplasmatota archaeon]